MYQPEDVEGSELGMADDDFDTNRDHAEFKISET